MDVGGRSAIRWVEIEEASNAILQEGIISDEELAYYFPSVAINSKGEVVIGCSGSSEDQYCSAFAVLGTTEDGETTFGDVQLLVEGVGPYQVGSDPSRWGDYSATVVDPDDDNVFWTFQEYASGTNQWSVRITQLSTVPEPASWVLAAFGFAFLIGVQRRNTRRKQSA